MGIFFTPIKYYNPFEDGHKISDRRNITSNICSICHYPIGGILLAQNERNENYYFHSSCISDVVFDKTNVEHLNKELKSFKELKTQVMKCEKVNFSIAKTFPIDGICNICSKKLGSFAADHKNGVQHPFHKVCIDEWLKIKKFCPYCREGETHPSSINVPVKRISAIILAILANIAVRSLVNLVGRDLLSSMSLTQRAGVEFFSSLSFPLSVKLLKNSNHLTDVIGASVLPLMCGAYSTMGFSIGFFAMAISSGVFTAYGVLGNRAFNENNANITTKISAVFSLASLIIISNGIIPSWQRVATSIVSLGGLIFGISLFRLI